MALGFMRRHRRWLYVFLWVVILGFVVFYIPAFRGADTGTPSEAVGYVGGIPITVSEFRRAYLQRRRLYEQLYQGRIDAAMLKGLGLEEQVFEALVGEKLVELEARRIGLRVGDEELAKSLTSAPDLQEDGRFIGSGELRRRLELAGSSIREFEEERRSRLVAEKLAAVVTGGAGVMPAEVEREFRRRTESVKAEYALADAARFRAEASATDAELNARFETRREAYRIPERRVVSYLLIDAEALRARVSLTERDLEAYYQDHRDEFLEPEQACASHVLVKVKASAQAGEGHAEEEARRIAEGVLERARSGADFAELAKKASEDKGSAPGGGDLGCFPRGRMLAEFDNAAFSLEAGQVSDLVRTSAGFHVIRLNSRREESVQPLAQVKERIRRSQSDQRVRTLLEESGGRVEAALRRGRSLDEAAKAEGLTAQKSPPFARGETPEPLSSPSLVARAFELKPGESDKSGHGVSRGLAFFALAEVQPSRLPELKDVQERLKADLAEEKALERARLLAAEVRARAEKLGLEKAAAALGLVRKETPAPVTRGQPVGDLGSGAALETAVFSSPEKTFSEPVRVAGGYAVIRVLEKTAFDPAEFEKQKPAIAASLRETRRNQLFRAYLQEARRRVSVERRPEALQRTTG